MKVLIINECDVDGGAEIQTKREYDMWKARGHIPYCIFLKKNGNIYFDENIFFYKEHIKKIKFFLGKFFFDIKLYSFIRNKINEINPDFIHVNNVFYSPYAVYKAIGNQKCLQTLRDYKVICPKSTKCLKDWQICKQSAGVCCVKCILSSHGIMKKIKGMLEFMIFFRVNYYRKKYVNKFIAPSQQLTDYCKKEMLDVTCIPNPFDFNIIEGFEKKLVQNRIYLYYGGVAEHKGILQLLYAFQKFSIGKNVELHIVGKYDREIRQKLMQIKNPKIKLFERMSHEKIIEKLSSVYVVVVPSLWIENYPNVVLEGFATECIVIASNRGGMVDQVSDNNCLFDVLDHADIIEKLEYAYYLSEDERKRIIDRQKKYLQSNNRIENYYYNLKGCIIDV